MGRGSRIGRIAAAATLALAGIAVVAPAADADFHFMKIREVFLGNGNPNAAFIELQMYAAGQTNVTGHNVRVYQADGSEAAAFALTGPVPNGETQRTILIGDTATGTTPDFTYDMLGQATEVYGPGGAVCFDNIDCVSWGGFSSLVPLPSPPGNPAPAIPNGSSLERLITPNCTTLLEDADDTNVSLTDFALQATPNPRSNTTPPTETACGNAGGGPDTKIDKGPKKKTKKKKAKFEFSSTTAGVTFECSVDGKTFAPCTSPFEVKVKKGKHEFEVRAVLAGVVDGSPAEQDWKVKKPKK